MPRQIIIHAGFHKTGTSSVQATLKANGPRIWPTHALVLPQRMADVTKMATMHSVMAGPVSKAEFNDRLLALFKSLTLGRKRGLILSAEDLAGLIPGRRGHTNYDACPGLMTMVETAVRHVWGSDTDITFYFGLRQRPGWLRSLYWQNLRSSRLTQDFDTFRETLSDISLTKLATTTRSTLYHSKLITIRLEDHLESEFGPATPILEAANLTPEHKARLIAAPAANVTPPADVVQAVLAANRSSASDTDVAALKTRLIQTARPVPKPANIA